MIINQTVLDEQDVDFICSAYLNQLSVLIMRIFIGIMSVLWIASAVLSLYLQFRLHEGTVSDQLGEGLICVIWGTVLGVNLCFRHILCRILKKEPSRFTPRTYTCDENSITASRMENGVEVSVRLPLEKTKYFFVRANSLVLRVSGGKSKFFYMCFHDDCYTEGSKEELLALLVQKGIQQK